MSNWFKRFWKRSTPAPEQPSNADAVSNADVQALAQDRPTRESASGDGAAARNPVDGAASVAADDAAVGDLPDDLSRDSVSSEEDSRDDAAAERASRCDKASEDNARCDEESADTAPDCEFAADTSPGGTSSDGVSPEDASTDSVSPEDVLPEDASTDSVSPEDASPDGVSPEDNSPDGASAEDASQDDISPDVQEVFEADEVLAAEPKPRLDDIDFTGFWHDTRESARRYISQIPDYRLIRDIERELGYRLPSSYIELMTMHNGGLINRCWCAFRQPAKRYEDYIQITGLLGIGRDTPYSLCGKFGSRFLLESWGHDPDIGVAIANTGKPGRQLVFLDYRKCGINGEPQVMCADRDMGEERMLARNFEMFIRGLRADVPKMQ